jgi:hypothetical protein
VHRDDGDASLRRPGLAEALEVTGGDRRPEPVVKTNPDPIHASPAANRSPPSRRARNGQRRCPNSPPHLIPGVCMTGTYPPWPRPLPMLPTHSSGGPDGDSDQADGRPSWQKRSSVCRQSKLLVVERWTVGLRPALAF